MYPLICINWNKVGGGGYFPWNKILVAIHIAKRTSNFKNKLKHNFHFFSIIWKEWLLWSWLYGGWIYNYLCNQYLSTLNLWVWILLMARCTHTTLYSLSVTCDRSVVFSGYSSSPHQKTDHDITETLLKVALNTIILSQKTSGLTSIMNFKLSLFSIKIYGLPFTILTYYPF